MLRLLVIAFAVLGLLSHAAWALLAAIAYALALWFTLRIVRSIAAAERNAMVPGGESHE